MSDHIDRAAALFHAALTIIMLSAAIRGADEYLGFPAAISLFVAAYFFTEFRRELDKARQ